MVLVQVFGKATLFITFTANPRWQEIVQELHPEQSPNDRQDVNCDVCYYQLQRLLHDIQDGCFGPLQANVWVIKY